MALVGARMNDSASLRKNGNSYTLKLLKRLVFKKVTKGGREAI
jgi:hypothetical protein